MDAETEGRDFKSNRRDLLNCYTDAPALHSNPILGSFHLLFWLFFHPSAWRNFVARIDASLPPDFTLMQISRVQWRQPLVRRLLVQGYVILPTLVGLSVGLTLWIRGTPLDAILIPAMFVIGINLTLFVLIGSAISVASGLVGGLLVALAAGIVGSITGGVGGAIAVGTAIGLSIGTAGSIAGYIASQPNSTQTGVMPRVSTQIGSVVVGVLVGVGVAALVRVGLTTLVSLMVGFPENAAYNLARSIVVGTSLGIAIGWRRNVSVGIVAAVTASVAYILAVTGGNSGPYSILVGLSSGLLFGLSFGVTVALPYVLSTQIAGPWAGAWAGALGSWGRHIIRNEIPLWPVLPLGLIGILLGITSHWWRPLLLYPFEAAWNLILYQLDQQRRGRPTLLRWHASFWDEFQRLPLTGLDEHLLLVMARNPAEGRRALEYLRTSHQRWAVRAVQIELEARRLADCEDVLALSQAHDQLTSGELAGPASALLRKFQRLSQDIEAALNQTTTYHQRLALKTICDRLNGLMRELTVSSEPYATRFYPVATHWEEIISDYLNELAETVERDQEIDNPYVVGVPLTAEQEIFTGRADIVARIEQLLLDLRRPPLLLYGQRRMGKTSLLRNLGRLLPQHIIPLFVDGQRIALASDYSDFLYNVAREIARSAEQQRHLTLPALSREAIAANPFSGFNEWLDEVEQRLAQTNQIALLALDEFEMLDSGLDKGRFDITDVLSMLRHLIQHRPHFKVMLAGSHTPAELQHWASYLINVQVIKIGCLAEAEARQLIEQPIKDFPLRYEPAACQLVLNLTRGHPALTQLLCYEIVSLKNEQEVNERRLARLADVEAAVPRALASGSFFFGDIEQNQATKAGLRLLRFIAAQGESAIVSREALAQHAEDSDQFDQTLARLLRRDLLEAVDGGYRFQIELVRRWFV